MKIGQVVHAYPPHIGGIENYVHRLRHALNERGSEVAVYTTNLGIPSNAALELNVNYCKVNFSPLHNPISWELFKVLQQSDDDIYHLHGYEFFPTLLATKVLKNKPKVLTQHGTLKLKNNLISLLLNHPYHPFLQYVLDNMDKIIVLGEKDKKFLLNSYNISPQKIAIIPNGIEPNRFCSSDENNTAFIKKYGLKVNSFKVLFVGRLVEQKNVHKLLYAVKKYIKSNIEIIIIGNGNPQYVRQLREICDSRMHLLGGIHFGKDLIAAYNVCDLFVLLSRFEGLPTVMLEAMACGLPVLTTPVGNIPEVIISGKNGLFIDTPVNEKDLADKLEYFMHSDNSKIRHNNKCLVMKKFNWSNISENIYHVYEDALEH